MKTFADYVNESSIADLLNGSGPKKAKWIIDKKKRGHIILKAGTKMLCRMCKYSRLDEPYSVQRIYATTRKNSGQLFPTFKAAMDQVNKMFTYGTTDEYDMEPMPKEVVDWLEKCTY